MNNASSQSLLASSGVNVNLCLHCQSCAGGCPFTEAMDLLPNRVLRLIQLGMEKEALGCSTIWACVSCNTCSIQCPMAIDIPAVMDALRHLAIENGVPVAEPDVLAFHREVLHSIEKYGRTHKLEIMLRFKLKTRTYFPGCSLATSAKENNESLIHFFQRMGINLEEIDDWNCCGSSSAHSIDTELADQLPARNLSLAPSGRPLMVACPSCFLRLKHCQHKLRSDIQVLRQHEARFGRVIDPDLPVVHFFEVLARLDLKKRDNPVFHHLNGLRCASYYGCMLARPPKMKDEKNHHGLMEDILRNLGATPVQWAYASRCCGTFLSVVRPHVVTVMVDRIIANAMQSSADCIVTACAMCHMNLEIRTTLRQPIPVLHFSELLTLAIGDLPKNEWFERHLIDPRPMLEKKRLA